MYGELHETLPVLYERYNKDELRIKMRRHTGVQSSAMERSVDQFVLVLGSSMGAMVRIYPYVVQLVPYDAVNRNKVSIRQLPLFIFLHSLHVSAPTGHLQVRYTIRCF
jgi:hypothetical protein